MSVPARRVQEAAQRKLSIVPTTTNLLDLQREYGAAFACVRAIREKIQAPLYGMREAMDLRASVEEDLERAQSRLKAIDILVDARKSEAECWLPEIRAAWKRFVALDKLLVAAGGEGAFSGEGPDAEVVPNVPLSIGHINIDVVESVATAKNGEELAQEFIGRVMFTGLDREIEFVERRAAKKEAK